MSLLVAGSMGVYIAFLILRDDSVGRQYMKITHYGSMFGLMKDVSNGLWGGGLCIIQVSCSFVVDATTRLLMEISERDILGVATGRHYKGSKMLRNYPLTRKISVSSFRHCYIGGVKKCACFLVHNIVSSGSFQE